MTAKTIWVIKPVPDNETIESLRAQLNVSKPIATMLLQRGIATFDEAKTFFTSSLEYLHDPFLMKDMDKAVARVLIALEKKEGILVYGDYDVDGTSSRNNTPIFITIFQTAIQKVMAYLPRALPMPMNISSHSLFASTAVSKRIRMWQTPKP
jgi:single-stranded-DNA-specific exonuclease